MCIIRERKISRNVWKPIVTFVRLWRTFSRFYLKWMYPEKHTAVHFIQANKLCKIVYLPWCVLSVTPGPESWPSSSTLFNSHKCIFYKWFVGYTWSYHHHQLNVHFLPRLIEGMDGCFPTASGRKSIFSNICRTQESRPWKPIVLHTFVPSCNIIILFKWGFMISQQH